ncbi:MAG: hypothetical protein ABI807_06455 [Sporichthyaceae bacterium]
MSDHRDLVAALLGVPGVAAAAVEPHRGGPGTLRLQLAHGADEVDVAGAVNRLLRSQFGLAVDADRVRVLEQPPAADTGGSERGRQGVADELTDLREAVPDDASSIDGWQPGAEQVIVTTEPEPASDAVGPFPAAAAGRLVIERVQLVSAHLGVTVSVTLRTGERSEVGEAEGAATSGALHRSVAEATLRAVEAMVDDRVRFAVEHVEIASTGEERTALAVLSLVTDRGTQRLSGASVVRDDARQAVIRAVLAAVNRRVGPMLGEVAG